MKQCQQAKVDFLIIGGGIAGLWLLADLKAQGYSVLLCESNALGAGQTIASQGIIHGGTKYALTGKLSSATTAIGMMPQRWKTALAGRDRVNLRDVKWLSTHQLLWTSSNMASKMTGFFASKVMQSRMQSVPKRDYPELFQHRDFKGNLYQLNEPVLDIPSLLHSFQQQFSDCIIHIDAQHSALAKTSLPQPASKQSDQAKTPLQPQSASLLAQQQYNHATQTQKTSPLKWQFNATLNNGDVLNIHAQGIILSSGEGNAALTQTLGLDAPAMQRRPLHMVMLKSANLPMIYAHALGVSDKPKMTITSHKNQAGQTVWYIGGEPAESGVQQTSEKLIAATQKKLQKNLTWLDFSPKPSQQWSTFRIDRAEGQQSTGQRPNQPVIQLLDNICVAWPTKLAFAPLLSDQIQQHYRDVKPIIDPYIPANLPKVKVAEVIWNR